MATTPLDHPAEGGQLAQDSSVGVKANGAVNGASDAETPYDATFYAEVARHLETQGFCLCTHCLGRYCFGTKASADSLVSAVAVRLGLHPMKLAHREDVSQRRPSVGSSQLT